MNDNINKLTEDILNLKISDAIKLIDALSDKLGIPKESLCATAVSTSNSGDSGDTDSSGPAKTEFDLILKSFGDKKLDVIKKVKEITGLGLKESKELVESCPKPIKEKISQADCDTLKKSLEEVGAVCEIK